MFSVEGCEPDENGRLNLNPPDGAGLDSCLESVGLDSADLPKLKFGAEEELEAPKVKDGLGFSAESVFCSSVVASEEPGVPNLKADLAVVFSAGSCAVFPKEKEGGPLVLFF